MYFVISIGYSNKIIVPMNESTSVAIKHIFGDKSDYVSQYYAQDQGFAWEPTDDRVNIEICDTGKYKEYKERGFKYPKK